MAYIHTLWLDGGEGRSTGRSGALSSLFFVYIYTYMYVYMYVTDQSLSFVQEMHV